MFPVFISSISSSGNWWHLWQIPLGAMFLLWSSSHSFSTSFSIFSISEHGCLILADSSLFSTAFAETKSKTSLTFVSKECSEEWQLCVFLYLGGGVFFLLWVLKFACRTLFSISLSCLPMSPHDKTWEVIFSPHHQISGDNLLILYVKYYFYIYWDIVDWQHLSVF